MIFGNSLMARSMIFDPADRDFSNNMGCGVITSNGFINVNCYAQHAFICRSPPDYGMSPQSSNPNQRMACFSDLPIFSRSRSIVCLSHPQILSRVRYLFLSLICKSLPEIGVSVESNAPLHNMAYTPQLQILFRELCATSSSNPLRVVNTLK